MNKPMWDWMDEMEGKKKGTSSENWEKEKKRQGYGKETSAKKKKVAGKMKYKSPLNEYGRKAIKKSDKSPSEEYIVGYDKKS